MVVLYKKMMVDVQITSGGNSVQEFGGGVKASQISGKFVMI